MSDNHGTLLVVVVAAVVFGGAYGWFSDKSKKLKANEFNLKLHREIEEEKKKFEQVAGARTKEIDRREIYLNEIRAQFSTGFIQGRRWLAMLIAEADRAFDDSISAHLRHKKHPAQKAAEEVAEARAERRIYKEKAKFLEYQLLSLKEYFPFLEEYENVILDESVSLLPNGTNLDAPEDSDPVLRFVQKTDYDQMPTAQRNQLALDRYLNGKLSPVTIGRLYERCLGYQYEQAGWKVEYHGILKGLEDLGRDLICSKGNAIKIVQAKCWSKEKLIYEKHIFQLFGTTQMYSIDHKMSDLFSATITGQLVTTTNLSPMARKVAERLKIEVVECCPLDKKFPMIKCNINQATKEKIYHLPFDQQYDRTKIIPELGECYASTTAEAEQMGFRRAFRHLGNFS